MKMSAIIREEKTTEITTDMVIWVFIIHSKYFPDSDWLKAHA